MYSTRTRIHARIPNGHPREEKRACRTKVRGQVGEGSSCVSGSWRTERAARAAVGRLLREDPRRAAVGEEVGVGVCEGGRARLESVECGCDKRLSAW